MKTEFTPWVLMAFFAYPMAATVIRCTSVPVVKPDPVTEGGLPSCESAYQHQLDASCPPEEDARGGWILSECAALTQEQRVCITEADTCAAMRGCEEAP